MADTAMFVIGLAHSQPVGSEEILLSVSVVQIGGSLLLVRSVALSSISP